jgi:hypothetical protein
MLTKDSFFNPWGFVINTNWAPVSVFFPPVTGGKKLEIENKIKFKFIL